MHRRPHPCRIASGRIGHRHRPWPATRPVSILAVDRSGCQRCRGKNRSGRRPCGPWEVRPCREGAVRFEQRAWIEIEDRFGIGLVARAWIVAPQHEQVAYARGCCAQQFALQRDAIAVTAGELQDRLDPLLYKNCGRRNRTEMGPCAGAVGDIDGIGQSLQWKRLRQQFGAVRRHRRRHFRSDYKALGTQLVLQGWTSDPSRKIQWTLQGQQWEKW